MPHGAHHGFSSPPSYFRLEGAGIADSEHDWLPRVPFQMLLREEEEYLVGRAYRARLIHNAHAVAVPVEGEADVRFVRQHRFLYLRECFLLGRIRLAFD